MTDIVERLRKMDSISGCSNLFARDAADEIERLRAEVERLRAGGCARDQRLTQWCAEAEAMRAALQTLCDAAQDSDDSQYGTLGTDFVRGVARNALAAPKEGER